MNEKSLSRWRIVTLITTTVAFIFAVTYALTGYIVFGQQTEGILNILLIFQCFVFSFY
jgi:membrane protein YdbS with pleckstrin-like domain